MASWPRFFVLFRKRYLKRYFAIITLLGSLSCIFLYIRYTLSETLNFSSKSFPNNILKNEEAEGGTSFSVQNFPTVHTNHGMMNEHVWWNISISETAMDALRNWPHFANVPNKCSFITDFHTRTVNDSTNKGVRIFGFIHPEVDGKYAFAITSSGPSELWLSPNEYPACSQLIARIYSPDEWASTLKEEYNKYHGQISSEISLYAGKKYYMESLSVNRQSSDETFVTVHWLNTSASKNSNFRIILSKYLSPFNGTNSLERSPRWCNNGTESNLQERFLRLPLMNRMEYMTLFPTCPYNPSFLVRRKLERYQGVWLTKESLVFPQDDTDMSSKERVKKWASPNPVINKNRVECIVNEFTNILRRNDIVLKNINNVIQKPDAENGDSFLLDLEVAFNCTDQTFRLTEHVYQKKESGSLCLPEGMIWNNKATIYFIIPVKEQGKWIHHFIKQVTTASVLTGDTNFHVIIADFESKDIDIAEAFNTSLLNRRHTVVQLRTGKFYKTLALNKAVEFVPNAHDIVFLFDLHIDVPVNIMDSIRKNTIAGRMVYFPIVGRLNCNSDSKKHRGFWQMNGFGLMAMYKSDWTKLGGMNTSYQYKWGREDWDLIDRVLMMSLEVERIKHPGLYHHCHPRQGMWN